MLYNAIDLNFLQWQHLEMENRPLVIRVREVVGSKWEESVFEHKSLLPLWQILVLEALCCYPGVVVDMYIYTDD